MASPKPASLPNLRTLMPKGREPRPKMTTSESLEPEPQPEPEQEPVPEPEQKTKPNAPAPAQPKKARLAKRSEPKAAPSSKPSKKRKRAGTEEEDLEQKVFYKYTRMANKMGRHRLPDHRPNTWISPPKELTPQQLKNRCNIATLGPDLSLSEAKQGPNVGPEATGSGKTVDGEDKSTSKMPNRPTSPNSGCESDEKSLSG
ncbi:hypothetical protein MKZ38_002220 [Zalerion maritima]|uniref:Uncharacterized protein n=1 Tax=Zalerion maritima TaxID=339359 RepID=A0AAD5WSM1_9PEZI|nr:hypothetical protein MKZ38_002220 [Zalerion maritima]